MGIAYGGIFRDKGRTMVNYVCVFRVRKGMKAGRSMKGRAGGYRRAGGYSNGKRVRRVRVQSGGVLCLDKTSA